MASRLFSFLFVIVSIPALANTICVNNECTNTDATGVEVTTDANGNVLKRSTHSSSSSESHFSKGEDGKPGTSSFRSCVNGKCKSIVCEGPLQTVDGKVSCVGKKVAAKAVAATPAPLAPAAVTAPAAGDRYESWDVTN